MEALKRRSENNQGSLNKAIDLNGEFVHMATDLLRCQRFQYSFAAGCWMLDA
jgi:hypothetical protein